MVRFVFFFQRETQIEKQDHTNERPEESSLGFLFYCLFFVWANSKKMVYSSCGHVR